MSRIYRPQIAAFLTVPTMGNRTERLEGESDPSVVTIPVKVRNAAHEQNDHLHADSLRLTLDYRDAGVDPRLIRNAIVQYHVANGDDFGNWTPSRDNLRFIGVMTDCNRVAEAGQMLTIDAEFLDYTTLLLETKPFPTDGIPDYSQNLTQAWQRICDFTGWYDPSQGKIVSKVAALRDSLVYSPDISEPPQLGKAVAARFARLGKVPVHPNTDAWAVWLQCVGMLGLISYVDADRVVVTTATNYYTKGDPPRLIWGRNLKSLHDRRKASYAGKGIGVTAFDPIRGTTLEAFWPPIGSKEIFHKRIPAKKVGSEEAARQAEQRVYFAIQGVTDPTVLETIAKRAYEERSRQELEGTATTVDMDTDTIAGSTFNLLQLRSGDDIRVEFSQSDKEMIAAMETVADRVEYLQKRGYSREVAELMARNAEDATLLDPTFYVKRVTTSIDADAPSFGIEVQFCNKINVSGDASS